MVTLFDINIIHCHIFSIDFLYTSKQIRINVYSYKVKKQNQNSDFFN